MIMLQVKIIDESDLKEYCWFTIVDMIEMIIDALMSGG